MRECLEDKILWSHHLKSIVENSWLSKYQKFKVGNSLDKVQTR